MKNLSGLSLEEVTARQKSGQGSSVAEPITKSKFKYQYCRIGYKKNKGKFLKNGTWKCSTIWADCYSNYFVHKRKSTFRSCAVPNRYVSWANLSIYECGNKKVVIHLINLEVSFVLQWQQELCLHLQFHRIYLRP